MIMAASAASLFLCSCEKVEELVRKVKGEEAKALTVSDEELAKSDAAAAKYLTAIEKVPSILAKVRDEKSAFAARKQLDDISREVSLIVGDLAGVEGKDKKLLSSKESAPPTTKPASPKGKAGTPVSNGKRATPQIDGGIYWYVRDENQEAYGKRAKVVAQRIQTHINRIANMTRYSPVALDVVLDGILVLAGVESGGAVPGDATPAGIKPMPKDWMPMGLTPKSS
ncbi:hypothetical protein NT6N_10600 [Oceaniferula spumae]|uniref:Uncharacterized protein n=1 Tax=Oceaniferula spumae TaxID=2979115 RepID=A0AAT9FJ47_9BACT